MTGCAEGFVCAYDANNSSNIHSRYCAKINPWDDSVPDRIPRYQLCSLPPRALQRVYGLPVVINNNEEEEEENTTNNTNNTNTNTDNHHDKTTKTALPQFAYLSTMGALDETSDHETLVQQKKVQTIIIMVHGSGMNADDYLCTTSAAIPRQQQQQHHYASSPSPDTVLVIAPWFVAPYAQAGPVSLYHKPHVDALRWHDQQGPIYHTWRYGAPAMNHANVSSYAAMDAMIDGILQDAPVRFPVLQRIVVAGHSAGGQYTQRWALLSASRGFADKNHDNGKNHDNTVEAPEKQRHGPLRPISLRVVVANPKSFCFLDNRRFVNGTFTVPNPEDIGNCTEYNHWQWGLERAADHDFLPTPYKDQAIAHAGGVSAIRRRYAARDVVYLAGELDILPNGNCMDRLQGPYRRQRSEHFMASLHHLFGRPVHHRLVVTGVYHNHALMFQSPEGQMALFGSWLDTAPGMNETVASESL